MKIGCDIVENQRMADVNEQFINLVLTAKEQEEYKSKGLTYLTGRFAAKEAVMKALPNTKQLKFTDIEILDDEDGQPHCNIQRVQVSISHEKNYSMAVALLEE